MPGFIISLSDILYSISVSSSLCSINKSGLSKSSYVVGSSPIISSFSFKEIILYLILPDLFICWIVNLKIGSNVFGSDINSTSHSKCNLLNI